MYTVLIVATSHGLLLANPAGQVQQRALEGLPLLDVIIHPEEPRVLYVASPEAGVWRTSDGGGSWKQILTEGSCSLAMDADDVDIVFAGTLDGCVLATADGGNHWDTRLEPPSGRRAVRGLLTHPATPEVLYASIAGGDLLRSADRGRSWHGRQPIGGRVNLPTLHPRRADVVVCANPAGIFRSEDGGQVWTTLLDCAGQTVGAVSVVPGNPDVILLGASPEEQLVDGDDDEHEGAVLRKAPGACALAPDLDDPGRVYGLTREGSLLISPDAGEHWELRRTRWPRPARLVPFSCRPAA